MKIISSGVTPKSQTQKRSPIKSGEYTERNKATPITSAENEGMTNTSVLSLIAASCDELGEKLSLAIADKQFSDFEEIAAKLVADLFSVSVSAERLKEDMFPTVEEGDE